MARAVVVGSLFAEGHSSEGKSQLTSLQKDFPDTPGVLNLQATAQLMDGHIEAARGLFRRAISREPNNLDAMNGLVRIELDDGRTSEAVKLVDGALKRGDVTGSFLLTAADVYDAAGDPDRAEAQLKRAIELQPSRLSAYSHLAEHYLRQDRLEDARRRIQQFVEKSPSSVAMQTMLAVVLEMQHKIPEAETQYRHVLTLDSHAPIAANNLAWMYVSTNRNIDEALRLAETAHLGLPDEPAVNDTLGWIYLKKNLPEHAIDYLQVSVQNAPNDPASHYHLGMAYLQSGAADKAKKELQVALLSKVPFDGMAEARQALAQLGG